MAPNQNYPRDGKPLGISLAPPEGSAGSKCLEMEVWDASSIAVPSLLAVFKAHDSRVPQRSCGQPDLSSQALSVSALKISSMNFSLRDGLS